MRQCARSGKPQGCWHNKRHQVVTVPGHSSTQPQALCHRADSRQQRQRRLPRLRQRRRNGVHSFRGSGQQLHPLGALRRVQEDLRRRRKLSIVVPDQLSFGSMSTRTSIISPVRGITATRKAALPCVRRKRRRQAIAPRRTSVILNSPVRKSGFQFVFVAMAMTRAAGSPSMTAIRAKVRAVSVRRTRTMALRTSAASLGVPFRRARASGGRG